jgi:hypothetical protein
VTFLSVAQNDFIFEKHRREISAVNEITPVLTELPAKMVYRQKRSDQRC